MAQGIVGWGKSRRAGIYAVPPMANAHWIRLIAHCRATGPCNAGIPRIAKRLDFQVSNFQPACDLLCRPLSLRRTSDKMPDRFLTNNTQPAGVLVTEPAA